MKSEITAREKTLDKDKSSNCSLDWRRVTGAATASDTSEFGGQCTQFEDVRKEDGLETSYLQQEPLQ